MTLQGRCGQALAVVPENERAEQAAVWIGYRIASYLTAAGLRVAVRRHLRSGVSARRGGEPLSEALAKWVRSQRARAHLVVTVLAPWPLWTREHWSRAHLFDRVLAVGQNAPPSAAFAQWSGPRLTVLPLGQELFATPAPADPLLVRLACELMIPLPQTASCTLPFFKQRVQT